MGCYNNGTGTAKSEKGKRNEDQEKLVWDAQQLQFFYFSIPIMFFLHGSTFSCLVHQSQKSADIFYATGTQLHLFLKREKQIIIVIIKGQNQSGKDK